MAEAARGPSTWQLSALSDIHAVCDFLTLMLLGCLLSEQPEELSHCVKVVTIENKTTGPIRSHQTKTELVSAFPRNGLSTLRSSLVSLER